MSGAHDPVVVAETPDGFRVFCRVCQGQRVFRLDPNGRLDNKAYTEWFKRDLLQPGENLYYRYRPWLMSTL